MVMTLTLTLSLLAGAAALQVGKAPNVQQVADVLERQVGLPARFAAWAIP